MELPVAPLHTNSGGTARDAILHVHIPKTAGTSIRNTLVNAYSPEAVVFYNHANDSFIRSSDRGLVGTEKPYVDVVKTITYRSGLFPLIRPFFNRAVEQEATHYTPAESFFDTEPKIAYRALSGHFEASQIESWGLENNLGLSIVREPLARAISHYGHYVRLQRRQGTHAGSPVANRAELMDLDEFLELPEFTNIQTRYLGRLANVKIGTIETCGNLLEEVGIPNISLPHLNKTSNAEIPHPGTTATAKFLEVNAADYELFDAAQNHSR